HPHSGSDVLADRSFTCAGVMMSGGTIPGGSQMSNFWIEKNWVNGGGWAGLHVGSAWSGSGHDIHIVGNRWGRDFYLGEDRVIHKSSGFHFTGSSEITGNMYEDNG